MAAALTHCSDHAELIIIIRQGFVSKLSWTIAQVTAFQTLIECSQTLSEQYKISMPTVGLMWIFLLPKFILYMFVSSNFLNCAKRIEN